MDYKGKIIELVRRLENEDHLKYIYTLLNFPTSKSGVDA